MTTMDKHGALALNSFQLKLLACAFMLIDHIGYLLLPQYLFLRVIGRLAFPIFAYMLANGWRYSGDRRKYLLRLLLFAVLFQPLYSICMNDAQLFLRLNILFTLALGLLCIICYQYLCGKDIDWRIAALIAVPFAVFAQLTHLEYGAYGLLLIFTAHLFFERELQLTLAWMAVSALAVIGLTGMRELQLFALAALPLLSMYNGERGRGSRWLFYGFYCLHIPLLYLLRLWLAA
ncbi:MAG: TraX family protein [Bacillota bacterium]|nr:TraX family protein [Bacillota bacterium]